MSCYTHAHGSHIQLQSVQNYISRMLSKYSCCNWKEKGGQGRYLMKRHMQGIQKGRNPARAHKRHHHQFLDQATVPRLTPLHIYNTHIYADTVQQQRMDGACRKQRLNRAELQHCEVGVCCCSCSGNVHIAALKTKWSARVKGDEPSRGKSVVRLKTAQRRRQTLIFTLR